MGKNGDLRDFDHIDHITVGAAKEAGLSSLFQKPMMFSKVFQKSMIFGAFCGEKCLDNARLHKATGTTTQIPSWEQWSVKKFILQPFMNRHTKGC